MLEPVAQPVLEEAARNGQPILLSRAQTALGDRVAVLRRAVQVGERSLPVVWQGEAGAANSGCADQQVRLERVQAWLPPGAAGWWLGERFYPSAEWFAWLPRYGWRSRLRLTGHLTVATGVAEATTGELAREASERYLSNVRQFTRGVPTSLGILQEAGHQAPWLSARDCPPTEAAVQDYRARWAIEPTFSAFQRRGGQREATHLQAPERLDRWLRIMTLTMYWGVPVGPHDARYTPTSVENKPRGRSLRTLGASTRSGGVLSVG